VECIPPLHGILQSGLVQSRLEVFLSGREEDKDISQVEPMKLLFKFVFHDVSSWN
jgi:hypothetical protein